MNQAVPLTIDTTVLTDIIAMAETAKGNPAAERDFYFSLARLTPEEKVDLYALFNLGRAGVRSFNVALSGAQEQNPQHIPGMLADNRKLAQYLKAGLKRYRRQS